MVTLKVYSLKGKPKPKEKLEIPAIFGGPVREDLIKRAVLVSQSARYQLQGVDWFAGKRTSAESFGVGRGLARLPRIKGSRHATAGRGAIVPMAVGGRSAHPPLVVKKITKKINKKERSKALSSAIAAVAKREIVEARGHVINGIPQIPLVVEDALEGLTKASKVREAFMKLGVWNDIVRAKERKIRSGKGKMRGSKYKKKKSILIVVGRDKGISKGAANFPGVDVVEVSSLSVEDLAPGAQLGRLTVFTKSAIQKLVETHPKEGITGGLG